MGSRRLANNNGSQDSLLKSVGAVTAKQNIPTGLSEKEQLLAKTITDYIQQSELAKFESDRLLLSKSIDAILNRIADFTDENNEEFTQAQLDDIKTQILDSINSDSSPSSSDTSAIDVDVVSLSVADKVLSELNDLEKSEKLKDLRSFLVGQDSEETTEKIAAGKDADKNSAEDVGKLTIADHDDNFNDFKLYVISQIDQLNQNLKKTAGIHLGFNLKLMNPLKKLNGMMSGISVGFKNFGNKIKGAITAPFKKIGDAMSNLKNGIKGLGSKIGGALMSPFKALGNMFKRKKEEKKKKKLTEELEKLMKRIKGILSNFKENALNFLKSIVIPAAKILAKGIHIILAPLKTFLLTTVMGPLWLIAGAIALLTLAAIPFMEKIAPIIAEAVPTIAKAILVIAETVAKVFTFLVETAWPFVIDTIKWLRDDIITPVWKTFVVPLLNWFVTKVIPFIETYVAPVLASILDGIKTIIDALIPWIKPLVDTILNILLTFLQAIEPHITPLVDVVLTTLESMLDLIYQVFEILKPVVIKLARVIADMLIKALDIIANLIMPILDAIKVVVDMIAAAIRGIKAVWNWIKNKLGNIEIFGCKPFSFLLGGSGEPVVEQSGEEKKTTLTDELRELVNRINSGMLFEDIADTIETHLMHNKLFISFANTVKMGIVRLQQFIVSTKKLVNTVIDLLKSGELFKNIFDGLFNNPNVKAFMDKVEEMMSRITDALVELKNSIVDIIEKVKIAVVDGLKTVVESIQDFIKGIKEAVVVAIAKLTDMVLPLLNTINTAVLNVANAITGLVDKIMAAVDPIKENVLSFIDTFKNGIIQIKDKIVSCIDTLASKFQPVADVLTTSITDIKDNIVRNLDRLTEGILEIPKTIVDSILRGIKAIFNVGKAIGNAVSGAFNKVKGWFGGDKESVKLSPAEQFIYDGISTIAKQLDKVFNISDANQIEANTANVAVQASMPNLNDVDTLNKPAEVPDFNNAEEAQDAAKAKKNADKKIDAIYAFMLKMSSSMQENFDLISGKLDNQPAALPIPISTNPNNLAAMENSL